MKNVEKWIIVILSVIALAAIGTAVYFGISTDKDNSVKEENKQEEFLENSKRDNEIKKINLISNEVKVVQVNGLDYKFLLDETHTLYLNDNVFYETDDSYYAIENNIYIINDLIMIEVSGSGVRSTSYIFLNFAGKIIKKFQNWNADKIIYGINDDNGKFETISGIYLTGDEVTIEFDFTSLIDGPTITTTTNVVDDIVIDSESNLKIIKDKLEINNDTIIEGTAKLVYKGNDLFSEVEIIKGNTLSEIAERYLK